MHNFFVISFFLRTFAPSERGKRCLSSVVEHFLGKEEVVSSSLIDSSERRSHRRCGRLFRVRRGRVGCGASGSAGASGSQPFFLSAARQSFFARYPQFRLFELCGPKPLPRGGPHLTMPTSAGFVPIRSARPGSQDVCRLYPDQFRPLRFAYCGIFSIFVLPHPKGGELFSIEVFRLCF